MRTRTLAAAVSIVALVVAGCATEPEKPAPKPAPAAPAPVAPPAPAPAPAPAAAPAPAPVAKPEAPKPPPAPKPINLTSTELFEFDKATLTPDARSKLDSEVIAKLKDLRDIKYIIVNGHADRLGSPQYNQALSEKRAEAVRAYLVSRGVDASAIETLGFGKTLPVKSCPDQKDRKSLIECLAPNRRVVVEVQGMPR
ncbi:MAG: outer membrane protein [Burkholderiales bacterium]|jgi:OOP family OmpA-OmpF porin|nr:outer membrane protein [Burkholderiales bacterium]